MITLLSDFGLQDASVAIAKGILMQHIHTVPIIDISHEVQPFNTQQAAYLLAATYHNFPAATCHVLLFDIFSNPVSTVILSEYNGHYFISADNGLLTTALGTIPQNSWLCSELATTNTFHDWLHTAGNIIALLGTQKPELLGLQPYTLKALRPDMTATSGDGSIKCDVIHIDQFENVVINFRQQQLAPGQSFRMQFVGVEEIDEISANYNDVRPGYKLCRFNSNGYLELCINRGKAASLFGLRLGSKFNDIKIYIQ
ncbi:MAG: hypothetical protein JWQ38_1766 [Flavipsychrobacter sp.]|nr:hypothetical protein [Flavipsychrobacter sp.]